LETSRSRSLPCGSVQSGRSDDPQERYDHRDCQNTGSRVREAWLRLPAPFPPREGLSADQGPFIGDLLDRAQIANGAEARKHLQFALLTTDHLDDGLRACST
jgi:hypothetical protein